MIFWLRQLITPAGRRTIKGPGLKVRYDVRRFWKCPACNRTRRAPIDRVSVRCHCRNDGTWMQLVEPGPQPPAFEVEYSILQADMPAAGKPIEDASEQEVNREEVSVAESAEIPAKSSSASEPTSQPMTDSDATSTVAGEQASANEEASDNDAFGTGIEVADNPAMPQTDSQPTADSSASTDPDSTNSDDKPSRKKGRRPNRRRRSRRGQKKNDGPAASDS